MVRNQSGQKPTEGKQKRTRENGRKRKNNSSKDTATRTKAGEQRARVSSVGPFRIAQPFLVGMLVTRN